MAKLQSKALVRATWRGIPEDGIHSHCCENLKSYIGLIVFELTKYLYTWRLKNSGGRKVLQYYCGREALFVFCSRGHCLLWMHNFRDERITLHWFSYLKNSIAEEKVASTWRISYISPSVFSSRFCCPGYLTRYILNSHEFYLMFVLC
jgi:hypothetical protein